MSFDSEDIDVVAAVGPTSTSASSVSEARSTLETSVKAASSTAQLSPTHATSASTLTHAVDSATIA